MVYLFILAVIFIVYVLIRLKDYNEYIEKQNNYTFYGQKNKYLLTRNELSFFYK